MTENHNIDTIKNAFESLINEQLARIEQVKNSPDWVDYNQKDKIIIGVCR